MIISDRTGLQYKILEDDRDGSYELTLVRGREKIGHASLGLQNADGIMLLAEIRLLSPKRSLFGKLAAWIRGEPGDYQQRGLGSLLLKQTIAVSHRLGAKGLVGNIVHDDLEAHPWLLDWYRREGFHVVPVECLPTWSGNMPPFTIAQVIYRSSSS